MLSIILPILGIHLLALMSPGPSTILIIKNSLGGSRKAGLATALGIGIGESIHVLYSILGLGFIISKSILALNAIKYAGGLYLLYLAYKLLQSKGSQAADINTAQALKPKQGLVQGFLTGVLNPKATIFFVSLFSLVIKPDTSIQILLVLGTLMTINAIVRFSLVSTLLTSNTIQSRYYKVSKYIDKIFGGLLGLFGIKLLLSKME
ncbi:MAG: LysE family transporter [Candidatus Absconditabacterales bacterium]